MLNTGFKKNRGLRYLKGALDEELMLNKGGPYTIVVRRDSSFGNEPDGKYQICYVVLMCESDVVWSSRLQPTVDLSTIEAE